MENKDSYSGFILTFEPNRTDYIFEKLEENENYEIKDSFSTIDCNFDGKELVFLARVFDDAICIFAMSLMSRVSNAGTRKAKVNIFPNITFNTEILVSKQDYPISNQDSFSRVQPDEWSGLIAYIKERLPHHTQAIDYLIDLYKKPNIIPSDNARTIVLNEQRDALGLALDIADFDRKDILKSINTNDYETANDIFDLLEKNIPIHERSLLEHDSSIFQKLLINDFPTAKTQLFKNKAGETVRVYITDNTQYEEILGIDLLIYNRAYNSYLLIQYKRMVEDLEDGWKYSISPSCNLIDQLHKMREIQSIIESNARSFTELNDLRLNYEPFYIKFCEQIRPDARSDSLIRGITLNLIHLEYFLTLDCAKGKKEGKFIGYKNCSHYLSNTQFIDLAKNGWIGGDNNTAELIKDLLLADEAGGKQAMLVVIDKHKKTSALQRGWKK